MNFMQKSHYNQNNLSFTISIRIKYFYISYGIMLILEKICWPFNAPHQCFNAHLRYKDE